MIIRKKLRPRNVKNMRVALEISFSTDGPIASNEHTCSSQYDALAAHSFRDL